MSQKYGGMANAENFDRDRACLVCDDPHPVYSWTDYSGEAYCVRCGTPYQLKWGEPRDRTYPYTNVRLEVISALRAFWQEKQMVNGLGTFMLFDVYPDQLRGRRAFNDWSVKNKERFPALWDEKEPTKAVEEASK